MRKVLLLMVAIVLVLFTASCKESKTSRPVNELREWGVAYAGLPGYSNVNWEQFGEDIPYGTPIQVEDFLIQEDGLYHVVWHVMCVNNWGANVSCTTCDIPVMVFQGQLRINQFFPVTSGNWFDAKDPRNWPEYHVGGNASPWLQHYYDINISAYLDLNVGDKVSMWLYVASNEGSWPRGGSYYYSKEKAYPVYNFQVVKMGPKAGIPAKALD